MFLCFQKTMIQPILVVSIIFYFRPLKIKNLAVLEILGIKGFKKGPKMRFLLETESDPLLEWVLY